MQQFPANHHWLMPSSTRVGNRDQNDVLGSELHMSEFEYVAITGSLDEAPSTSPLLPVCACCQDRLEAVI